MREINRKPAGFAITATKWRTYANINWRKPLRSYLSARVALNGCHNIRVKLVRYNRGSNAPRSPLVFQVEGYELPHGDFK